MSSFRLIPFVLVAALFTIAPQAAAQQKPTTAEAQAMLQNPVLLQQLRQKIMTSGLTAEQVRARLRAEGYPENLLDAYLPGATSSGQSTSGTSGAAMHAT